MAQVSYGTITIIDTKDIESIVVEYARNQSTTNAPTSGWSTTRPTWEQGYYIWQRTRIHKTGMDTSTDEFGTAVCITGSTGNTGAQGPTGPSGAAGRSLTNTITQYTTAASSITITESNMGNYTWSSNVPAYSSSTPTYWVRVTNTYSNPSSTEYIIYKDNGTTDAIANSVEANNTAAIANSIAQQTIENSQGALAQAAAAQYQADALDAKLKYFFYPGDSNYPGVYAASGISGTTFNEGNISTYGYNVAIKPASISIGYNNIKAILIDGSNPSLKFYAPSKTTQASSPSMELTSTALIFNKPSTGNKAMELASSGLVFYDGSAANGGNIQAQFGASGAIQSGDYAINATTDKFSTYGTKIDLVHGEIYSPYFRLSQGTVNGGPVAGIYISGTFEATGALIGYQKTSNSDTNAYWKIGYMTDTNQDKLTYQRADSNGFIELAPNSTFILQKNKIHTGWFGNNGYLTYPQLNSKYYDFGMNLPTSLSDKFLYIRYNSGSNLSTIYQNDSGWTYPFYVDAEGKVHAQNFYIGDSTTPIGGGSGTIAEKLMSGAGSATQPVYFRSDSGHVGEVATTTYQLNAAGAKGVDTSMPATATDSNVPTTKLMKTFVEGKGYITGYTETDPTVPSWAKAENKPSYSLNEITDTEDLRKIEALTGTSGFLKKTAANTWGLDTNTYLTSYTETDPVFIASVAHGITSSDISNWNSKTSNTGTVTSVQVQASSPLTSTSNSASSTTLNTTIKFSNQNANLVLAGPSSGTTASAPSFRSLVAADIPNLSWSKITSGNDDLQAIEALTGTSGFLKKTAANTWSLDTTTYVPTTRKVNGHALSSDITVSKSDVGLGNVNNYQQVTAIGQGANGTLRVWTGDPTSTSTSDYSDISITITAYEQSTVNKAAALDLGAAVGTTTNPVYFKADGKPYSITDGTNPITIAKSVPADAKFTDTTYTFDGTYNASSNKAATVSTVTNAVDALDGNLNNTTPGAGKTLTAFSQTNGIVSATFGNISITKSQISDFPTEMTPAAHTHTLSIATDSSSTATNITLAHNTKYKLTAGGSTYLFTTPSDNNTDTLVTQTNTTGNADYRVLFSENANDTTQTVTARKNTNFKYNPSTGNVMATKFNNLTLTAATTGFTIAGGTTTSKTLTVSESYTLGAACAKTITDSSSASAISTGISLPTERDIYYGLPTINNSHAYTSNTTIYAPTAGGTANTQALVGNGTTTAPKWIDISPSISITAGTASATPKINVTVLGQSGTAQSLTTASTSVYGATKLSSTSSSTEQGLAATPKLVYDSINNAASNYVAKSGDTMTGALTTPELIAQKIKADDVNVTHLLTAEGIQTKNWTAVNIATIDGSFYITPTISTATAKFNYTSTGTIELTPVSPSVFTTNSLFINGDATNWTQNSLIMITGSVEINGEYIPIGTIKGTLSGITTTTGGASKLTLSSPTTNIGGTPSVLGLVTRGTQYNCKDLKVSIYSYYNNSHENLLGIMMTTAGTKNRTYIDIYDGTHQTNGETDAQDSSTTYTRPVVRIGNLRGLPNIVSGSTASETQPTGWGIYTTNGFFEGKVVANAGKIANWTIESNAETYNGAIYNGTFGSSGGVFITPGYTTTTNIGGSTGTSNKVWTITAGQNFGLTTAGVLYAKEAHIAGEITATSGTIGGWTANSSYGLYTNSKTSSTSTNTGILIQKDGGIYAGAYNSTNGACPFQVTSAGALTATSGKIGGWNLSATALYYSNATPGYNTSNLVIDPTSSTTNSNAIGGSTTGLTWFLSAGRSFGVTRAGVLYATGATINGTIKADNGYIAGSVTIGSGGSTITNSLNAKASNAAEYEVVIKVSSINYTTSSSSATLIAIPTQLGASTTGSFIWYKNTIGTAHGGTVSTTTNTNDTLTVSDLEALYIAVLQ